MNQIWQDFLQQQSATFNDQGEACWNPTSSLAENGLCDLSHLGLIDLVGEDTETFLQGQLTNDIKLVDETHWSIGSYCSVKGRIIASFTCCHLGDRVILQMPTETQAILMKRFPMFVMMSKVTVTDPAKNLLSLGCWGEESATLLKQSLGELPEENGQSVQADGMVILRMHGDSPRFQLIGETEKIKTLWQLLSSQATPTHYDDWRLLEIRAGFPCVFAETSEAFVPQMVNLHLIGGVSFTKGCFVGQEIVARMKYLGKIKRRMYIGKTTSNTRPQLGEKLHSSSSSSGQGAGKIVDVRPAPGGGFELLAVAEIAAVESEQGVHLDSAEGPSITFTAPPYGFEEA